ncbi:MAG: dimethylarginine dimethylaminohydrolase family protein [Gemmatimonadales bacterium]
MTQRYGGQTMWEPLRRVVVRRPDATFGNADPARWHYAAKPDMVRACQEHQALVETLMKAGAEVIFHDEPLADHADAIFCHDPVLVADNGAILLRMGKPLRRGEEEALGRTLEKAGVPIAGRLTGDALAESGDLMWLDAATLAAGIGFRTNYAGVEQLRRALPPSVSVVPVELPYFTGPDACLHLMSLISMVDRDLAVVYPALLPVTFMERLARMGIALVEAPEAEFRTMATNVLALAPRRCVMLEGNPITQSGLERAGCSVTTYRGAEVSLKAEGGATCLTRPVLRG